MINISQILRNLDVRIDSSGDYLAHIEDVIESTQDNIWSIIIKFRILGGDNEDQIGRYHQEEFYVYDNDLRRLASLISALALSSVSNAADIKGKNVNIRVVKTTWMGISQFRIEAFRPA